MEALDYFNGSKSSKVTRFLWWCAGADRYFLERSPMQDRVKYAGIGGIVLCTGVLAMFSGGFAFYTAFGPKGYAMDQEEQASIGFLIATVFFAIAWGLIIFNFDRFIVSSTGKGDGTDSISGKEFLQALPRITIAIILGFAISTPMEIRILKSEIDNELDKFQKNYTQELNAATDSLFKQKRLSAEKTKKEYDDKLATYETELKAYDQKIDELTEKKRLEMQDRRAYGEGPVAKAIQRSIDDKISDREKFVQSKAADVAIWRESQKSSTEVLAHLDQERDGELKNNELQSHSYSGLLKRIQISHEVGGVVPWIIFLVILCIEMGPIFFKMMMTKGPYDYMVENHNHLMNVRNGVVREEHIFEGKNSVIHMEKWRYLEVEKARKDKETKLEALGRINKQIVGSWEDIKIKQVEKNPEAYYKETSPDKA